MNTFSGKRILLVGATGVLGRGYAKAISELDVDLVIADIKQSNVLLFAEELGVKGVEIDISNEDSVVACIKYVNDQLGGLDSVINNAAATGEGLMKAGSVFEDFEEYPLSVWKKTIDINLTGAFLLAREAGRLIKETSRNGNMINVSSIYGVVAPDHRIYKDQPFKSFPGYSASKSGIIGLSKWLSTWWGGQIRVNCVTPGGVFNGHNDAFVKSYSDRVPMGRMADRDELIGVIIFLLSDSSSYITGQNIIVDGGYTVW